jgi:hypothetical protein
MLVRAVGLGFVETTLTDVQIIFPALLHLLADTGLTRPVPAGALHMLGPIVRAVLQVCNRMRWIPDVPAVLAAQARALSVGVGRGEQVILTTATTQYVRLR